MTYTESNSGLYEKNRAHFAAALGTERLESLDQQYIKKRSLQISADSSIYDINAWLSDEKKAEWATYRQKLRDLPATATLGMIVEFPDPPS